MIAALFFIVYIAVSWAVLTFTPSAALLTIVFGATGVWAVTHRWKTPSRLYARVQLTVIALVILAFVGHQPMPVHLAGMVVYLVAVSIYIAVHSFADGMRAISRGTLTTKGRAGVKNGVFWLTTLTWVAPFCIVLAPNWVGAALIVVCLGVATLFRTAYHEMMAKRA